MLYLGYCLFAAAMVAYWEAFMNMGFGTGEILSDVGNAILLSTAVLLLLRLTWKQMDRDAKREEARDQH